MLDHHQPTLTMNTHHRWIIALLGTLLLGGCRSVTADGPTGGEDMKQEMMQADRDYCEATAEHGIDGWASYYADDGVKLELGGDTARGPKQVAEQDAPMFEDPSIRLSWEPVKGFMYEDGVHGFTTGRFCLVRAGAGGEETELATGNYVTVWRRGVDGWKIILDTGAPDPPPGN